MATDPREQAGSSERPDVRAVSYRLRLADRLANHPFLSLLVLNPAFLAVLGFTLLGAILVALALPKLWVVTPRDFRPQIKISLVDRVQAWSLKRSAVKLGAAGQVEAASRAWAGAIANNPGDPELIRGFLQNVGSLSQPPPTEVGKCLAQAQWLLGLTGTNRQDAGLVARTCDRLGVYDPVIGLLQPHQGNLTPAEEAAYQKALFQTGRLAEFGERIARASTADATDPELALCKAAYAAAWGPPAAAGAVRERLARAADDPGLGMYATRLELPVHFTRLDPDGYHESLERLQRRGMDRLEDHARYWLLLQSTGKADEARRLAQSHQSPPTSAAEVLVLSRTCLTLGVADHALQVLRRFLVPFGDEPGSNGCQVRMIHAQLLLETKAWDELFAAAIQMRASPSNSDALAGVSYYWEGRAFLGQERTAEALAAFSRAVDLPFPAPATALGTARSLLQLGQAELAAKLLERLESALQGSGLYWHAVFEAAWAQREDSVLLSHAARQAYLTEPTNQLYQVNHAAALLINREAPAEAVKLTMSFLQQQPESPAARLNHAFALAQNQRLDEAEALLNTIPTTGFGEVETTMYDLAWLQVRVLQQRPSDYRKYLRTINTNFLFPSQLRWLDEVRTQATTE
jgi:tetratricopeptide (TPR) repeat protein